MLAAIICKYTISFNVSEQREQEQSEVDYDAIAH